MHTPRRFLEHGARATCGDDRLLGRQQFGLHKQVAESRMQFIRNSRCQYQLSIGGDFDRSHSARAVADGEAPKLDIILGRDRNLGMRIEAQFAAAKFGFAIRENCLVILDFCGNRLIGR